MHYHVLGLNESSVEDDTKKPIINWLFDLTLKNNHPQDSAVMPMINEAKEGLEDLLRYNDVMRQQGCVHTSYKYIEISSDSSSSFSSDKLLETSSEELSDSGKRKNPNKPMT